MVGEFCKHDDDGEISKVTSVSEDGQNRAHRTVTCLSETSPQSVTGRIPIVNMGGFLRLEGEDVNKRRWCCCKHAVIVAQE